MAAGRFEYAPGIRSPEGENFDEVEKVLDGDRSRLKALDLQPGDLQVFFGRYSLHRVTPVQGEKERHTVIFAYAKEPGFIGRPERAQRIFGRMGTDSRDPLERGHESQRLPGRLSLTHLVGAEFEAARPEYLVTSHLRTGP